MSASPSPSAGGDTKQSDQVHFRFCREWYVSCLFVAHQIIFSSGRWLTSYSSNLLYPKEDRVTNQLMYSCRTCHVSEPATSYCVYQNNLNSQVGDTAGVTQDVISDPTVCLQYLCTLCGEVVMDGNEVATSEGGSDGSSGIQKDLNAGQNSQGVP